MRPWTQSQPPETINKWKETKTGRKILKMAISIQGIRVSQGLYIVNIVSLKDTFLALVFFFFKVMGQVYHTQLGAKFK